MSAEQREGDGKGKTGNLVVLLLAERARSEGARSTRAIEDRPGYPVKRKASELGGSICCLVRRPQWDQHECPSWREKTREREGNVRGQARQAPLLTTRICTM